MTVQIDVFILCAHLSESVFSCNLFTLLLFSCHREYKPKTSTANDVIEAAQNTNGRDNKEETDEEVFNTLRVHTKG